MPAVFLLVIFLTDWDPMGFITIIQSHHFTTHVEGLTSHHGPVSTVRTAPFEGCKASVLEIIQNYIQSKDKMLD